MMRPRSYPLSVVLHLISVITYGYSLFWLFLHDLPPRDADTLGGRLKFLTYWDLWMQFITFTIALVCDFITSPQITIKNKTKQPFIIGLRDTLFNTMAFPFGAFVSVSFWSIYAIDRELIFPTGIEKWYPIWLNHTTHTFILPIVLVENYLVSHNRHNQKHGILVLSIISVVYGLWILYLGVMTNHWVYPVLEVLNWPLRVVFIISSTIALFFFYLIGGMLSDMTWKSSKSSSHSSTTKTSQSRVESRVESRKKLK